MRFLRKVVARLRGWPEAHLDLERLTPCERELWDRDFACGAPREAGLDLWLFGYACMLECSGPPDVVIEWLDQNAPGSAEALDVHFANLSRARREGRL